MQHWICALLERPVAVLAWAVALLLGGAWMAMQVPLEWVPRVELPEVRIAASWPGASPRAVERYVAAPIERAVGRVAGTAHVESLAQEGQATVVVGVAEGTALGPYVAQVNEQLALLEASLPERVVPRLTKELPEALRDEQGFMTIQLVGPQRADALRRLAEERLAPRLRSLEGVAEVTVRGGAGRELLVTLQPERMAAQGVTPQAVRQALRRATTGDDYGRLRAQGRAAYLLQPPEDRVDALRDVVVGVPAAAGRPVRLDDVARVRLGPAPRRSISRIDGEAVVTLTVDRAPGSHLIAVADAVRGRLETERAGLPEGLRLLVADDKSEAVRAQLRDLSWRGGLGLALVVLALLFMLQSVRATGVVLFSVAVALAVALALMQPLGLTLNLLTLAGLVLVFGLLVDNSVVMTEQLILQRARRRSAGRADAAEAASEALRAVWLPLLGGTLTTMAVMVPLVYLSGELRALFLPFGVLVALTLAASLAGAAVLVPVLGRSLPPAPPRRRAGRALRRLAAAPYRAAARFPKATLGVLLLLLGTPLWLLPRAVETPDGGGDGPRARLAGLYNEAMGSDLAERVRAVADPVLGGVTRPFVQLTDFGAGWDYEYRPEVSVWLGFPPGNPIGRADSLLQRFEQEALAAAVVQRTLATVTERTAYLRVQFVDGALQTAAPYVLREELIQEAIQLAGIDVSVSGLLPQGYFSGSGSSISGITVEAHGPNYEDLRALAQTFADRLKERTARVAAVDVNAGRFGRQQSRQVLRVRWTADAQARSGVEAGQLAGHLTPVFATRFPAFYAALGDAPHLPVRIVVEGAEERDVERVAAAPLRLGDSTWVQLAALSDYVVEEVPARIERENQQYKRYVLVDYRGPYRMGRELVTEVLDGLPTPPGYRLAIGEGGFFTEEVQRAFGWVLLATLGLVFLVTAAVFESWRLPLVVLLSVPTAAVGVALGFLWAEARFAEGAFIGVVLLVGIAANDSILLVDRYRQLRRRRPYGARSVLARLAVRERLRPMWTTTLTSALAMLPLLVFPEDGEFWTGLAVTVTGGLLAATLLAPLASVALLTWGGQASRGSMAGSKGAPP